MNGLIYGLMAAAFRLGKSAVDAVSNRSRRPETPYYEYTIETLRERFRGRTFSSRSLKAATEYWNGTCLWCGRNRIE
jgi:formate hydrogenlyase subunit 6/NADH:ubiquinone oxidoreductase subunit I